MAVQWRKTASMVELIPMAVFVDTNNHTITLNSKNYKYWDFPIVRSVPFTVPESVSIKIEIRKEGFEMWISNWRIFYDHRMDKIFAQTVTFFGEIFVRECVLHQYSGLKKSLPNEIVDTFESTVLKKESSNETEGEEEESYYKEDNDSEDLDSNEDDE